MFSVIVPVYNVEAYLRECIDSVLNQSYRNIEVILVDDGSTDHSGEICDEYVKSDNRVKCIHKTNGGLSDARNTGISVADGEYIVLVDSDDKIEYDALSEIDDAIRNYNFPDVVVTEITNTHDMELLNINQVNFITPESVSKEDVIRFIYDQKRHVYSAVQYICKKSFIDQKKLTFPVGYYHEDNWWTPQMLIMAESFGYYNKSWYIRRLDSVGSITNTVNSKRAFDIFELTLKNFNSPLYNKLSQSIKASAFNNMAVSTFSNFIDFRYYSVEDRKKLITIIKENFFIYDYVTGGKYRFFIFLMKLVGIGNTLWLYSTFHSK